MKFNIFLTTFLVIITLNYSSAQLVVGPNGTGLTWDWPGRTIEQISPDGGSSRVIRLRNSMSAGHGNPLGGFDFADHSGVSVMRILNYNVGIGSTNPQEDLHIFNKSGTAYIQALFESSTSSAGIQLKNNGNQIWEIQNGTKNDATTGNDFFIYDRSSQQHRFLINSGNGYVGIGTTTPDAPLTVAGNIHAREIKVTATAGGADFVFADDYALPSLQEVKAFVKENKHLPEIPSAAEMEADGLHLAEMNIKLLQKVEELTLYMIDKDQQLKEQEQRLKALEELVAKLAGE